MAVMSRSRKTTDRRRASAYSLLELTIVLAIIASLMAIAWPRVMPMMTRGSMREAGRQVKAELAVARQSAIQSGRTWEFRILPGTGNYLVAPPPADTYSRQDDGPLGTSTEAISANDWEEENAAPELLQLPDGLVFSLTPPSSQTAGGESDQALNVKGSGVDNLSANPANSDAPPAMIANGEFDELVGMSSFEQFLVVTRFFPDGRSANRTLYIVESDTGHQLAIHVRGLTGGVLLGDVERSIHGVTKTQDMSNENRSGDNGELTERGRSAR